MELDEETREQLGYPVASLDRLCEQLIQVRRDTTRNPNQVAWVIAPEAKRTLEHIQQRETKYQKAYASTESGKERRRAASRAYRQRRKAS